MKVVTTVVVSVLSAVMIALAVFLPPPEGEKSEEKSFEILTLWHVDAFEGGTGSRASYLKKVCEKFEKNSGCLITVINETADDVVEKIGKGVYPDILSYSACVVDVAGIAAPLDKNPMSAGGELGGKYYAACWAYGGYVEIIAKGVTPARTIVSKGKFNYPELACIYADVDIKKAEYLSPQRAYEAFLQDKTAKLIGTQRDVYRLKNKLEGYDVKPVGGFTDLMQYVSVTSTTESKRALSKKFVSYLLSEGQKSVNELGLMSVDKSSNNADNGLIDRFFTVDYNKTLSVFTSCEVVDAAIKEYGEKSSLSTEKTEFFKTIVKSLK